MFLLHAQNADRFAIVRCRPHAHLITDANQRASDSPLSHSATSGRIRPHIDGDRTCRRSFRRRRHAEPQRNRGRTRWRDADRLAFESGSALYGQSSNRSKRDHRRPATSLVDGILFADGRLYAAQIFLNQIAEIDLSRDLSRGTMERIITSPFFESPTSVARHGDRLAVVNSKIDTGFPPTAATYEVVVIEDHMIAITTATDEQPAPIRNGRLLACRSGG